MNKVKCRSFSKFANESSKRSAKAVDQLLQDANVKIPIFCGPMYPGSNPELVAAVSKAGGLGIVQPLSMTHLYGHDFREGLRLIKQVSGNKPFGVNFTILKVNKKYTKMMDEWMDISIEEGVKFFLTSLGKPNDIVKIAQKHNIKVYHDVHNAELAHRAIDAGVDGLNLLNSNMGGQTGSLSAERFLEDIQKLNCRQVPLLCAGGIGDAQSFAHALDLGYAGVQMGTRFLATHECKVTNAYKQGIVNAKAKDIVLTNKLAGTESSVINTPMIAQGGLRANPVISFFLKQSWSKSYARMFLLTQAIAGYKKTVTDESNQIWQAGKGVEHISSVESVDTIMQQFAAVLSK